MIEYWIWLTQIKGIGIKSQRKLIRFFKTPERVYNASKDELIEGCGLQRRYADILLESKDLKNVENIIHKNTQYNVKIVTLEDELYKNIGLMYPEAPILLYYTGYINTDIKGIGIMGSRSCTDYGKRVIDEFLYQVVQSNETVISDTSEGINNYVCTKTLKMNGNMVCVMPCGLDKVYPNGSESLIKRLKDNGVMISKYPVGEHVSKRGFVNKNFIMKMLMKNMLVVELAENSHIINIVKDLLKGKKEVFSLPNNIYNKFSIGCNKLLNYGAKAYYSPDQIIRVKDSDSIRKILKDNINSNQLKILNLLNESSKTINEISKIIDLEEKILKEELFDLELKDYIKFLAGKIEICP